MKASTTTKLGEGIIKLRIQGRCGIVNGEERNEKVEGTKFVEKVIIVDDLS